MLMFKETSTEEGKLFTQLAIDITKTGNLNTGDLKDLGRWLKANKDLNWEARKELAEIYQRAIDDGRITIHEIDELYRIIQEMVPWRIKKTMLENRKKFLKHRRSTNRPSKNQSVFWKSNFLLPKQNNFIKLFIGMPLIIKRRRNQKNQLTIFYKNDLIGCVPETQRYDENIKIAEPLAQLFDGLKATGKYTATVTKLIKNQPVITIEVYKENAPPEAESFTDFYYEKPPQTQSYGEIFGEALRDIADTLMLWFAVGLMMAVMVGILALIAQ